MKLTELDAKFYSVRDRQGMGIIFDCPCGKCDESRKLAIPFKNPLDGGPPEENERGWTRTGDTIETLSLTPSILRMEGCKWHGFITNGEAKP